MSLIVYLHAGGFTSGDKADDAGMLAWLCSKGYAAAGIDVDILGTPQYDDKIYRQYMKAVEEYLEKYMPIGKSF